MQAEKIVQVCLAPTQTIRTILPDQLLLWHCQEACWTLQAAIQVALGIKLPLFTIMVFVSRRPVGAAASYRTFNCCAEMRDCGELGYFQPLEIKIVTLYCTYIHIVAQTADCFLITVKTRASCRECDLGYFPSCLFSRCVVICSEQIGDIWMKHLFVAFLTWVFEHAYEAIEKKIWLDLVFFSFELSPVTLPNVPAMLPVQDRRQTWKTICQGFCSSCLH